MLALVVTVHLALTRTSAAVARRGAAALRREEGQTSAEYALVLLGAASVALLVVMWAKSTGAIGELLDSVFGNLQKMVKGS
jgi:Flp pilus assembly pilin Flp